MVVNPGKNEMIEVEGKQYRRLCIKTHVITDADNITDVVMKYAAPEMQEGDTLFITEKAVACTQKRAIPMTETMEMAIRECGTFRILVAAAVSAVGKLFGIRGWFYKVAGEKARSIDGPCDCTLPPYNEYVVLGPADPDKVAAEIYAVLGKPVLITDINDIGGVIMGAAPLSTDRGLMAAILRDNPLGQSHEQTPMGIIRPVAE